LTTSFSLPLEQRRRLVAGDYRPVLVPLKPHGCELGATYGLSWSTNGSVRWLTVTDLKRHRRGGWLIRFTVTDLRTPHRYLRRTPPVWDPIGGRASDATTEADMSSYTSSRWGAMDELEAVPRGDQERMSKKANAVWEPIRQERAIAGRRNWKQAKEAARRERRALDRYLAAA
jgi:hypothetical protein